MEITRTGPQSTMGRLATMLGGIEAGETPLERRLREFGNQVAIAILAVGLALTVGGLLIEGLGHLGRVDLFSVALAVAAVPEGLPAVLTLTLAMGVERLAKHKAIVRRLSAVEALGSVTVIATDKTGTLTENRMHVRALDAPDPEHALRAMVLANDAELATGAGDQGLAMAFLLGLKDPDGGTFLLPLTAVQLLWINVVADGPPALALAFDRNPGVMSRPPRPPSSKLLDQVSLRFIAISGTSKAAGGIVLLGAIPQLGYSLDEARTALFLYKFRAPAGVRLSQPSDLLDPNAQYRLASGDRLGCRAPSNDCPTSSTDDASGPGFDQCSRSWRCHSRGSVDMGSRRISGS